MYITLGFLKLLSYCLSKSGGPTCISLCLCTLLNIEFLHRKNTNLDPCMAFYLYYLYIINCFLLGLSMLVLTVFFFLFSYSLLNLC